MNQSLDDIIEYGSESNTLDFKGEQYPLGKHPKRNEILKDFLAFANHPSDSDKYIVLGVHEKNGVAHHFTEIDDLFDEAKYQELIESNIEPKINFEYKLFEYKGKKLAYFRIFGNTDRPYLIKKDVKNPADGKTDFRLGDGFIRTGASTKKIGRVDFDKIYEHKLKARDRKSDIQIIPYLGHLNDTILSGHGFMYMDLEIVNNSNKSLDIDIEMKILKTEDYILLHERDIKEELRRNTAFSFKYDLSLMQPSNFHVNFENKDSHIVISRNRIGNRPSALSIPQNSSEKEIFFQDLVLVESKVDIIRAQVIIRSDGFTDGALVQEVEYKIK
ncbi:ATP-binding protein [Cesiribacter sp. SM1]|uniref:ATP-binding protein n=1 Tax=Cesiribacter sp. SM1 TaxID=2861196 RepID=UPI001CD7CA81|nr:ATP-binding protein [Cesiribacter sp. SM1]